MIYVWYFGPGVIFVVVSIAALVVAAFSHPRPKSLAELTGSAIASGFMFFSDVVASYRARMHFRRFDRALLDFRRHAVVRTRGTPELDEVRHI